MTKQFVGALDDLQWPAKIVASYSEQQRFELRNPALPVMLHDTCRAAPAAARKFP